MGGCSQQPIVYGWSGIREDRKVANNEEVKIDIVFDQVDGIKRALRDDHSFPQPP
jgi:hypothetical protein